MKSKEKYCWTSGIMCFIWIRFDMLILILKILPSFHGILHHSLKKMITILMIFHSNCLINLAWILFLLSYMVFHSYPIKQNQSAKKGVYTLSTCSIHCKHLWREVKTGWMFSLNWFEFWLQRTENIGTLYIMDSR